MATATGTGLALNGEGRGLINSQLVPSILSEYYTPASRRLVTGNLLVTPSDPDHVEPLQSCELIRWFGAEAQRWERLAVYGLPAALPNPALPVPYFDACMVMAGQGLWVCSEHGGAPSIQWALHSGTGAEECVSVAVIGPYKVLQSRGIGPIRRKQS